MVSAKRGFYDFRNKISVHCAKSLYAAAWGCNPMLTCSITFSAALSPALLPNADPAPFNNVFPENRVY